MEDSQSVCLNLFFSSMGCPFNLKLHIGIDSCICRDWQSPSSHLPSACALFIWKHSLNNFDLLLLLPVESMSANTDCSLLLEPLHSAGLHVIKLYTAILILTLRWPDFWNENQGRFQFSIQKSLNIIIMKLKMGENYGFMYSDLLQRMQWTIVSSCTG